MPLQSKHSKPRWHLRALVITSVAAIGVAACSPQPQAAADTAAAPTATIALVQTDLPVTTPVATEAGAATEEALATAAPETAEEAILVAMENLIGMEVTSADGQMAGTLQDLLFQAETGNIRYAFLITPDTAAGQVRLVPWENLQADASQERLTLTEAADLSAAPAIDLAAIGTDTVVIQTEGTDLPGELMNMVRASQLDEKDLRQGLDPQSEVQLGEVEDVLVDVQNGAMQYAVVDITTLLGDATADVIVPWQFVQINTLPATGLPVPNLGLNVTADTLMNAPRIDLDTVPAWIEPGTGELDTQPWQDFWNDVG